MQQILRDIDAHCHLLETCDKKDSYVFNILCNIKNTTSDRAATEKRFHKLLQQYRQEILPQVLDTWSDLTQEEQEFCSSMNNLYSDLHLLVAMADVTENALKHLSQLITMATLLDLLPSQNCKDSTNMKVALLGYCEQLAKHCRQAGMKKVTSIVLGIRT